MSNKNIEMMKKLIEEKKSKDPQHPSFKDAQKTIGKPAKSKFRKKSAGVTDK